MLQMACAVCVRFFTQTTPAKTNRKKSSLDSLVIFRKLFFLRSGTDTDDGFGLWPNKKRCNPKATL